MILMLNHDGSMMFEGVLSGMRAVFVKGCALEGQITNPSHAIAANQPKEKAPCSFAV